MAYLGKTPSQATRQRFYFTAAGGETSLSGSDDNGNTLVFSDGNYVDVMLNGVTLVAGTDYNTTTANTIGGLTALTASDVVEIVVYDTFSVFGGNVNGNFNIQNGTLSASQGITVDNDGATVATFDRATSDGAIAEFQKDNTTVGSIGVEGNDITIDGGVSNHSGLRFSSPAILPRYNGALADNQVDLGQTGSNYRFKDLYLSGGVYLGGTGAANHLDDYEEGTWTPTLPNGGTISSITKAQYTKIGRLVRAFCFINFSSITNNGSQFQIGGLPFPLGNNVYGPGSITYMGSFNGAAIGMTNCMGQHNSSVIYFHRNDGTSASLTNTNVQGLSNLIVGITYETSS